MVIGSKEGEIFGSKMMKVIVIKLVFVLILIILGVVKGLWVMFCKIFLAIVKFIFINNVIKDWGNCRVCIINLWLVLVDSLKMVWSIVKGGIGYFF